MSEQLKSDNTMSVDMFHQMFPWWQPMIEQSLTQVKSQWTDWLTMPAPWQANAASQQWIEWGKSLGKHWGEQYTQHCVAPWQALMSGQGTDFSKTNVVLPNYLMSHLNGLPVIQPVAPEKIMQLQQDYLQEFTRLSQDFLQANQQEIESKWALTDRRFLAKSWQDKGVNQFNALLYLLNAKYFSALAESVDGDIKTKQRIQFSVQQWIDAMSPSNFLATNPDAQRELVETKGESLRVGIENLLTDLAKGRISQSDETAFVVGKNVATTEGAVVFQNAVMQVIHYKPRTANVAERPLLIVPPCINKYYILDLQPDNSLVKYALDQGNNVFLVSWCNANQTQANLTWDDYVDQGVIQAINVAKEVSGAEQINSLGFCIGGTLLSCALNVLQARGQRPVASMTLLTTMLDFSDAGILDVYVDETQVALREQAIGKQGLMPGRDLASAFSSLRANDLIWHYVVNNYLKGQHPPAFDLLYWNSDSTNLPGPMYCWYLRNTYLENKLCQSNVLTVCGETIDFRTLDIPVYALAAREDHIVPWHSAYLSSQLLGGDCRFVLTASGHIAGVVNPASKNKRNYWVNDNLSGDAQTWFDQAESQPGSWWHDWTDWLKAHQGSSKLAPATLGNVAFPVIEDAPGSYVKAKA